MNSNMTPIDWAKRPLQKYADFSGRAPRAEFWWFVLLVIIAVIVGTIVDSMLGLPKVLLAYGPLSLLVGLATFLPNLAVQVRRLHDRNKSGLWLLGFYVPYVLMMLTNPLVLGGGAAATSSTGMTAVSGLLAVIVLVMAVTLLVFYCLPGTPGDNRYGPNPYGEGAVAAG